jgi:hypothetical protein
MKDHIENLLIEEREKQKSYRRVRPFNAQP